MEGLQRCIQLFARQCLSRRENIVYARWIESGNLEFATDCGFETAVGRSRRGVDV